MADLAEARAFALSLPSTNEEPHHEMTSFRVKRKIFATAPDEAHLHVFIDEGEVNACVAPDPAAFEQLMWGIGLAATGATPTEPAWSPWSALAQPSSTESPSTELVFRLNRTAQ
jgi:hypothetical protein